MTYRRHATQQVADATPPKSSRPGKLLVLCYAIPKPLMNVIAPIYIVAVRRRSKPWKQRILQVIVCIDESRQHMKSTQVDAAELRSRPARWSRVENAHNPATTHLDRCRQKILAVNGPLCSVQEQAVSPLRRQCLPPQ